MTRKKQARPGEHHLDEALVHIHTTSPTWRGALASHAPMAAEALIALGRADRVADFLAAYDKHLEPATTTAAKRLDDWTELRGSRAACSSLIAHFEACIDEEGVRALVERTAPVLFPGVLGGAFHGLLRLAHALRAWEHVDNALRRREVAIALGYWASEYLTLAGDPGADAVVGFTPVQALQQLPALPPQLRIERPSLMTERAARCETWPRFLQHIRGVDFDVWTVERTISELCGAGAALLLRGTSRFAYLHVITATSALREVLPYLQPQQHRLALKHHWHALAALHGASQPTTATEAEPPKPPSSEELSRDALVQRALSSLNDHTIKLTAAALREYDISKDARLLNAAWVGA